MSVIPQSEPNLEPKFFFGLNAGLSNSCFFVNDDLIVYRAAGVIVIHDTTNNSQKFVYLNDAQKTITTMDINNHRYRCMGIRSFCYPVAGVVWSDKSVVMERRSLKRPPDHVCSLIWVIGGVVITFRVLTEIFTKIITFNFLLFKLDFKS